MISRISLHAFQETKYHMEIVLKNNLGNFKAFGDYLILKLISKNVQPAEMNQIFKAIVVRNGDDIPLQIITKKWTKTFRDNTFSTQ